MSGRTGCALRWALMVVLVALAAAPPSHAAFPGQNGKIAFHSAADGDNEIYTINPDGSGITQLTHNTVADSYPNWSPSGQEIVFTRGDAVWKMSGDGSGQAFVAGFGTSSTPAWTTNDQQIVFPEDQHCEDAAPYGGIYTANTDGSDVTWVTCGIDDGACCPSWSPDGTRFVWSESPAGNPNLWLHTVGGETVELTPFDEIGSFDPDWSPDAQKVLYTRNDLFGSVSKDELYTLNPDGTGPEVVRDGSNGVWSPDGTKVAFRFPGPPAGIWTANADGSGATFLTAGFFPSWQPIPINGYARPKSASPLRVSLVPAYQPCTAPNRTHGPPLGFGSCNPPAQASSDLTVGTPDANGAGAASAGSLRLKAVGELPIDPNNGDQSDVEIDLSVTDVRNSSDLTDYTGDLTVTIGRRITDKDNTPHPGGPGAATTQDNMFSFDVPCAATGSATIGATCELTTTADTLVPGEVVERQRAIWQFDQVQVDDASGDVFLTQGVFIP